MAGVTAFVGALILLLVLGTYLVQALVWVAIGGVHLIAVAAQALFLAVTAIIRPSIVAEAWRRSQPG